MSGNFEDDSHMIKLDADLDEEFSEKKTKKLKSNENEDEDVYCTISKEDVPPVPSNNFLMRRVEVASEQAAAGGDPKKSGDERRERNKEDSRHKDAVGRKVKGRGALVSWTFYYGWLIIWILVK